MRAMNATEVGAVFGGVSGVGEVATDTMSMVGAFVDSELYREFTGAPTLPGDPQTWPGDLAG